MSQKRLTRLWAPPIAQPVAGVPLVRSTPELGWKRVRIKGTIDVESGLTPATKKKRVYWGFKRFIDWMEKEGHHFAGHLEVLGPFPHMEYRPPDVQKGERGAQRLRARPIASDLGNNGKEDYVIQAHFWVKEFIQELPSDVARQVIGRPGIRALRPKKGTQ